MKGAGYSSNYTWSTVRYYHAAGFCLQLALTTVVSPPYRSAVSLTVISTAAMLSLAAQCSRV